jgi:DNA-binding CsgD family transcriptional regulator
MDFLSDRDMQILNQCIQQIYAIQDFDTFRTNALSIVHRLVPNDFCSFYSTNIQSGQISNILFHNFTGSTPDMERITHQYFGEHPIVQNMPQTLSGVHKISDFISQQELHSLEGLYHQYLLTMGIEDQIVFFIPPANARDLQFSEIPPTLDGFALHRPQRNFTERDRQILNLLIPHLFQASANVRHYQQLQQQSDRRQQYLDHLGLVIVDVDGQVRSIAPQAITWLETYFQKPTSFLQLPDTLWSWIKYYVNDSTDRLNSDRACSQLRIQQANRELIIRLVVETTKAEYLLLLEERTISSLSSLELLGLSQRETEVLFWVMRGKDNKTIALKLNISSSTVRSHLEHIYIKWGVQSRTEAISLALDKLGFSYFLPR